MKKGDRIPINGEDFFIYEIIEHFRIRIVKESSSIGYVRSYDIPRDITLSTKCIRWLKLEQLYENRKSYH